MMKFFNTSAGKWLVIMLVGLLAAWFVWSRFFSGLKKGAGEAANAFNFTDPNNNSYKAATTAGKSLLGSTFTLSDLFPKSAAEKAFEASIRTPTAGIQAPRTGDTTLADVQAQAKTIFGNR